MTFEFPCDCAGRHMRFMERDWDVVTWELLHPPTHMPRPPRPVPSMHQHEDERCCASGMGGCPGLPHCRDWIIGSYNAGIALAEIIDNRLRAFELRIERDGLELDFARRKPLEAP